MARTEYRVEITVQTELGAVGPEIVVLENNLWCELEWGMGHAEQLVPLLIGVKARSKQSFREWSQAVLEVPAESHGWGTWNAEKSAYISVTVTPVVIEAVTYLGER